LCFSRSPKGPFGLLLGGFSDIFAFSCLPLCATLFHFWIVIDPPQAVWALPWCFIGMWIFGVKPQIAFMVFSILADILPADP
jgi:hypothetical protein